MLMLIFMQKYERKSRKQVFYDLFNANYSLFSSIMSNFVSKNYKL
jgi:hypothetical protein